MSEERDRLADVLHSAIIAERECAEVGDNTECFRLADALMPLIEAMRTEASIDALGRAVVWARRRGAPPLTVDDLHRYAIDRTAWLRGVAPR